MRFRQVVLASACAIVLAAPAAADTEGFVRFTAGVDVPVAGARWRDGQDTGAKINAGAALLRGIGAMATVDYALIPVQSMSELFPSDAVHEKLRRLRALGHVIVAVPTGDEKLTAYAHAGVGLDRVYTQHDILRVGTYYPYERRHDGVALELGASLWRAMRSISTDVEIGIVLAFPIAIHTDPPTYLGDRVGIEYTSVDIDLLVGIRITTLD